MGIRKQIEEIIKGREFSADNCRKHQQEELQKQANLIIDDIKALINYKVDNTNEKAIIYSISDGDGKKFKLVEEYFENLGFNVFRTKFKELGDYEFLVISWLPLDENENT